MDDALAVYIEVAEEHRQAIDDARMLVANGMGHAMARALVAIDEAMRDLTGEVGMT